ncbi:hypothetical protein M4I32_11680, partial [Microbacterium sp. LRZ72]|nr:hypothetical protein [Microbacterium sp. LRZ72]
VRYGSAANATVDAGKGVMTLPALETRNMMLEATPVRDLDLSVDFSLDAAPQTGNAYAGLVARQGESENYQVRTWLRSDGSIWLVAQRGNTVLDFEILSGLTRAAGDTFTLRMSVTGADPTTISAKLWPTGTEEPADWQLSVTDATPALQGALPYGLHANRASNSTTPGVFTFDEFRGIAVGE